MKFYHIPDNRKTLFLHLASWTIFIAYEMTLIAIVEGASGTHSPIWLFVVSYAINIALFYFHALFVLNYCLADGRRRIILSLVLIAAELSAYLFLTGLLQRGTVTKKQFLLFSFVNIVAFARQVWRGIYFMIFGTAWWMIQKNFQRVRRVKELEKKALVEEQERQHLQLELMSAQNAFLQAQINPHLLFNTLNFIHSEVQEVSDKASEAVIILSDMMRYSLIENKMDGKVELEKEIQQIENLIRINQYRFNNRLFLSFCKEGEFENHRIVPLILVPFAENLFKYAELNDADSPARVNLVVKENVLEFSTSNKKRRTISFPSTGIGIKNVKTRLSASYPHRFSLQIKNDDDYFSVYLTIML